MTDRPTILLTNPIHSDAMALLERQTTVVVAPNTDARTLREHVPNVHGIVVRSKLPGDIIDHAPRLRGIVRHGVGLDFIPVAAATAKGVPVANLPGVNVQAVAEYCFAALLHLRRPVAELDARIREESWENARSLAADMGEIGSTTLGIVGVGSIGRRVAGIARGFGMRVLGTSRRSGRMPKGVEETGLDDLFQRSDVVVLSCPLTEETRGLVDARRLASMKPESVLINAARGPVVDACALVEALRTGSIAGAAMDVFDVQPLPPNSDLFDCPRLLLTPHVAGITSSSMRDMSVGAVEEMLRLLRGERPKNLVNPDCLRAGTSH